MCFNIAVKLIKELVRKFITIFELTTMRPPSIQMAPYVFNAR